MKSAPAPRDKRKIFILVMTDAQRAAWEQSSGWNAFDLTKVWAACRLPATRMEA